MIARVAVWEPMPDDDRDWVIQATKDVPGVLDGYHLIDPQTGNGLSIAFFDDEAAADAARDAIAKRAEEIGWHDVPRPSPARLTFYNVMRYAGEHAHTTE